MVGAVTSQVSHLQDMGRVASTATAASVTPPGGSSMLMGSHPILLLVLALSLFFVAKAVFWMFVWPFWLSPLRHIPGPKTTRLSVLGQTPNFLKVSWLPLLFHEWSLGHPESPFIRYLGLGNSESLVVNSITAYREVLTTKCASFVKPSLTRVCAAVVIGDGLPFAEGHAHRSRRAVLNKLFSVPAIKAFMPELTSKATKLVDAMEASRTSIGEVEVESFIWQAVLDVIGIKVLGVDLDHLFAKQSALHDLFSRTMQQSLSSHIVHYLSSYLPLRHIIPMEENRNFLRDCEEVRHIIRGYVSTQAQTHQQGRKHDGATGTPPDAIRLMLESGFMSQEEVVEYALNLLVLGHDTTACSLVWAVYCLAENPECQDRIRSEVKTARGDGDELSYGSIEGLRYLESFIKEVLRLYCPVAYVPREATEDVEIAGVFLPKGTIVQPCPAVMNLHPSVWGSDAESFRPDRWEDLQGDAAGAYAFQTFHNGPRVCIGKQLSMVEMKVMLVELLSRFRVEALTSRDGGGGRPTEFASPSFTLRPKEKLRVRLVDVVEGK